MTVKWSFLVPLVSKDPWIATAAMRPRNDAQSVIASSKGAKQSRKPGILTFFGYICLTACFLAACSPTGEGEEEKEEIVSYDESAIGKILAIIHETYLDDVKDGPLIQGALEGMVASLDPYSRYLSPDKFKALMAFTTGEYVGVGIEITPAESGLKVVTVMEGSPAQKAGLQSGDIITHINNTVLPGMAYFKALSLIHGKSGSEITLRGYHKDKDQDPFALKITRVALHMNPVESRLEGDIGYLRLRRFNEKTAAKLEQAIEELQRKHMKPLKGIIMDLRNNPGGTLPQAIAFCNLFLSDGLIASTQTRGGEDNQIFHATGRDRCPGVPMIILINKGSASAAEIVTAALRHHKRALVMGTRSFGKGLAQVLIPLPGLGGLQITTARILDPKGSSIEGVGIEPDILVTEQPVKSTEGDPLIQQARDVLKGVSVFKGKS
jgi:carboxyl-terminal processing protease